MQLIMGAVLTAGVFFAKQKRYRAHGIFQSTVLLVNLLMIGLVMWPSFRQQLRPALPKIFHRLYYAAVMTHALVGITAEALGLYIVVVAGTEPSSATAVFHALEALDVGRRPCSGRSF